MSNEEITPETVAVPPRQNIVQETITELQKTTWPTQAEATRLTAIVVGVVVVLAVYMGVLDFVLAWLVKNFGLIK